MAEITNNLATKIAFSQYHLPGLLEGKYEISVTQELAIRNQRITKTVNGKEVSPFTVTRTFTIAGERFVLQPTLMHAAFPPEGSLGDHAHVLPHVIFNRSTLPWERATGSNAPNAPWLALLLFSEEEKPSAEKQTLAQISLKALKDPTRYAAKFPALTLESGQSEDDQVTVIDVKQSLLQSLLPAPAELALTAHVRQGTDDAGKLVGEEVAVLIGKRLPLSNGMSTVHLVSLEGRYTSAGFNYQNAGANDLIRLVSLFSWRFACVDEQQSFAALLQNLDHAPGTLRLPANANASAEKYLSMGCVAAPHFLRHGERTVSWYHGPLVPGNNATELALPARAADELVRYHPSTGMFDVSYAAVWELGRALVLKSNQISTRLYQWKRGHAQQVLQAEQRLLHPHLPHAGQTANNAALPQLPKEVEKWFQRLRLLHGVPFNYLVPDERMLPKESLRFFWLDAAWLDCLEDGAFSVGRVSDAEQERDRTRAEALPEAHPAITGFLMRSDVVAGWPGLLMEGYDFIADAATFAPTPDKLEPLRIARLSENVLLGLFAGELKTLDFHLKPETLHFGLESTRVNNTATFSKNLRGLDGKALMDRNGNLIRVAASFNGTPADSFRVLDLAAFAASMKTALTQAGVALADFNSATLALEMIAGMEKIRFRKISQ